MYVLIKDIMVGDGDAYQTIVSMFTSKERKFVLDNLKALPDPYIYEVGANDIIEFSHYELSTLIEGAVFADDDTLTTLFVFLPPNTGTDFFSVLIEELEV